MSKQINALKLALEALELHERIMRPYCDQQTERALKAIKEALANHIEDNLTMVAQQSQDEVRELSKSPQRSEDDRNEQVEPVAEYIGENWDGSIVQLYEDLEKGTKLYTTPPQRKPCPTCESLARTVMMDQASTDAPQRKPLTDEQVEQTWERTGDYDSFARAIEAAHGIGCETTLVKE